MYVYHKNIRIGKRLCLLSNHHFFKHPTLGFLNTLSATTPPRPTADDGRETPAARSRPTPRGRAPFAGHRPPHWSPDAGDDAAVRGGRKTKKSSLFLLFVNRVQIWG
ncbi:hypothetical protein V6Z11_A01G237700 [Gossypium hirsutum]